MKFEAAFLDELCKIAAEAVSAEKKAELLGHITGPSGSGKTSLLRELQAKYPKLVTKDIDEFHDVMRDRYKALGKDVGNEEYDEEVTGLIRAFLEERKKEPVLLGGGRAKAMPSLGINEDTKWLLNTGPLLSAWRRYRRPNERPWVGPVGERLGSVWSIPGNYLKNRRQIKKGLALGYKSTSREEIAKSVAEALDIVLARKMKRDLDGLIPG